MTMPTPSFDRDLQRAVQGTALCDRVPDVGRVQMEVQRLRDGLSAVDRACVRLSDTLGPVLSVNIPPDPDGLVVAREAGSPIREELTQLADWSEALSRALDRITTRLEV